MKAFNRYVHRVFARTLLLILAIAGIFLLMGHIRWARGIVLGGAASLVNLLVMAGELRRQGPAVGEKGIRPLYGSYALRMAITAAALIYAASSERIAFWAAVPALFASQLIMTGGELLGSRKQETT